MKSKKPYSLLTLAALAAALAPVPTGGNLVIKSRKTPRLPTLPETSPIKAPTHWGRTQPGWRQEAKARRWKELSRRQRRNRRIASTY